VQLGLGGEITFPQNMVVNKEVDIRGSFRFHGEFALAADLINRHRVDVRPLISETMPLGDAVAAFELASDRKRSMKVQIAFA
jgi:L-idonate 5-dehydrogenase